ncbi:MAG: class I SAM-dependent methyltransferase [Bacteroidales bacterium]|nr:class I SAM-dependent methyltransferase [Bacteroidales bacterium]
MHSFIKSIYHKCFPKSTFAHKLFWRYRYYFQKAEADYINLEKISEHPHRLEILKSLNAITDVTSVLEIGASWGPNLFLIAKNHPAVRCHGIDISANMVKLGKSFFEYKKIKNISLEIKELSLLRDFKDNEFDVVLSDAVLVYSDDKHINKTAYDISRIAKKAVILSEFDDDSGNSSGFAFESDWVRDYKTLFSKYSNSVQKKSFTEDVWPGKWSKYGKLITILLNKN